MAAYRVQYREGYRYADGEDHETLDAEGFALNGDGMWVDFYNADKVVVLRVRAKHVVRIELIDSPRPQTPEVAFDPLDDELAG